MQTFRSKLVAFLQEMSEAGVSADAYFCCALLRGIASSDLPLEGKARLFRSIYQAIPMDVGQHKWWTLEIAATQSDLSLFEQAAKGGIQLPWIPAIEQRSLANSPVVFGSDEETVYDRFTILCTMLRHQIYRQHWQGAVRTYKGLLELSVAPALQKMVPQQALHGCFIRLVSALLAEKALQRALDICLVTMDSLGPDSINQRIVSRILLASASGNFHPQRTTEVSERPKHLVPTLRFVRKWAEAALQAEILSKGLLDVEEGRYRAKTLRSVITDFQHLDRLTQAALHKVFHYAGTDIPLNESLEPFRELIETLLVLDTQVGWEKWYRRLQMRVDKQSLSPSARRRWERAAPLVQNNVLLAAEKSRRRRRVVGEDSWMSLSKQQKIDGTDVAKQS